MADPFGISDEDIDDIAGGSWTDNLPDWADKLWEWVSKDKNAGNMGAVLGMIGGGMGWGDQKAQSAGYQGKIPEYTSVREQLPHIPDQNFSSRTSPQMGRRYFTDTYYGKTPENQQGVGSLAAAQDAANAQKESLVAQNPEQFAEGGIVGALNELYAPTGRQGRQGIGYTGGRPLGDDNPYGMPPRPNAYGIRAWEEGDPPPVNPNSTWGDPGTGGPLMMPPSKGQQQEGDPRPDFDPADESGLFQPDPRPFPPQFPPTGEPIGYNPNDNPVFNPMGDIFPSSRTPSRTPRRPPPRFNPYGGLAGLNAEDRAIFDESVANDQLQRNSGFQATGYTDFEIDAMEAANNSGQAAAPTFGTNPQPQPPRPMYPNRPPRAPIRPTGDNGSAVPGRPMPIRYTPIDETRPQRPAPRPNPYMSGTPNPFLNDTPVFAGGSPTFDETQPTVGTGGPFITDIPTVGTGTAVMGQPATATPINPSFDNSGMPAGGWGNPSVGMGTPDNSGMFPDGKDGTPLQVAGTKPLQVAGTGFGFAGGGIVNAMPSSYLNGPSDGMADQVPAMIDNQRPASLSHGEMVIPADVVSHMGNGNSDAGAKQFYDMMDRVRKARTGNKQQGNQINPNDFIPR